MLLLAAFSLTLFSCENKLSDDRSSLPLAEAVIGVWAQTSRSAMPTGFFPCYTFYEDGTGTYWSGPDDIKFDYIVDAAADEVIINITWSRDGEDDFIPPKGVLDEKKTTLYIYQYQYWDLPDGSFTGWHNVSTLGWNGEVSEQI